MTRKRWIILGSVLAALATIAVVGIIIVGGGDDQTGPAGAPPSGFGQVSQELQDCLAEQGIDPGSGPPAGGAPDSDVQRAFEACRQYLPDPPEGGEFPGAPPGGGGRFTPPSS